MKRSLFDLSYTKLLSMDMGLLYPVMHDEVYPGDHFTIGNSAVVRMQPMVSPCLTPITLFTYYFFVPYRILDENWEEFITGGRLGDSMVELPRAQFEQKNPKDRDDYDALKLIFDEVMGYEPAFGPYDVGSLWDYLGMPPRKRPVDDSAPMLYPFKAYYRIWWDYFRDENLIPDERGENGFYDWIVEKVNVPYLFPVAWKKDYFTSALPWQQRGDAPAIPLSGMARAIWDSASFNSAGANNFEIFGTRSGSDVTLKASSAYSDTDTRMLRDWFNSNNINLANIGTFNIADLRLMYSVQKWMEKNARGGARYVEIIKSHFGFSPTDSRLDRPEFIGGTKLPVVVSEVLQTSETTAQSPQGSMAGHGILVDGSYVGKYRVKEHGVILGLAFIRPDAVYQDGINRQWLRRTRYDFYWPLFQGLSEQAIENNEIFTIDNDVTENQKVWAYQGRYDELRHKRDIACGQMRSYENTQESYGQGMTMPVNDMGAPLIPPSLDYWNLARSFKELPDYSWKFMMCRPDKRIMAVQDEPAFLVSFRNNLKAVRQMAKFAVPSW
ncbi:major capsid protein [Dipodfec virus UOA04_Rod_1057]|nr:major capsid protein [Dipodfec virus UOA04_Rod_1057]